MGVSVANYLKDFLLPKIRPLEKIRNLLSNDKLFIVFLTTLSNGQIWYHDHNVPRSTLLFTVSNRYHCVAYVTLTKYRYLTRRSNDAHL
jgi:hypothetical protein